MKSTWLTTWLCLVTIGMSAVAEERKNIVLIAGPKSHGPEGNRIHDYPWSARLLKTLLENSNLRDQVNVLTYLNGWPPDTQALRSADTIMIISDGRDGELGSEAPHLVSAERVKFVDSLVESGCGLITFHFSTFAPDRFADQVLDWYGGYFDWETDGERQWYSDITTIKAEVQPADSEHPLLRGVSPFTVREEFYFDIRFRPNDPQWVPIWSVAALPATKEHGEVVAWAVERSHGSRGFATTCGHFYDNWKIPQFRKTILNAIAWTAHLPVPPRGIESRFYARDEIAAHLAQPDLLSEPEEPQEDRYADSEYWYQPGHPVTPAGASSIKTLPGFVATRMMSVPEELGSWTALCVDDRGRLITAAQHRPGLYRVTVPPLGDPQAETKLEKLGGVASRLGWSHGLLYAFDSLYVTVSEENESAGSGLYRLRDTDGDDQFDHMVRVLSFQAAGEHGPHNVVVGPDGDSLFIICGNGTSLPDGTFRTRPMATSGLDHLLPPGFESSSHTSAGWVGRLAPDGRLLELVCSGLRNSFDLAFNRSGDLFTFDSDMEWDLGAPWYRPTRICQLVSGGEFGWRGDAAKWPEYFPDSVAPVINVGPASPSGMVFGYGTRFPGKYQNALYACDWTFATIHAVHLQPDGAGYKAEVEEFLGGRGLPITDIAVGKDGAIYFVVGGRRLGSALYRVHYAGDEPVTTEEVAETNQQLPALRRRLEEFHGEPHPAALDAAWSYLGHHDRAIRFAARVAVEAQPVDSWRARALATTEVAGQLTALLALARQGDNGDLSRVLDQLNRLPLESFPPARVLAALRVYELALARGEDGVANLHDAVRRKLRSIFPEQTQSSAQHEHPQLARYVDRELARLLCFLQDDSVIDPLLARMAEDRGERPELGGGYFVRNEKYGQAVQDMLQSAPLVDRMHHAQMLIWIREGWSLEQRRRYFELLESATAQSRGGYWYGEFWQRIRAAALDQVPEADRSEVGSLATGTRSLGGEEGLPQPVGPGQDWSLQQALALFDDGLGNCNFENGKKMFAAARCVSCHRFHGTGNAVGPDLSSLAQRFTIRDILDSTLHPSKAISDQYRITMITTSDGRSLSGRVVSRDAATLRLNTNLMRPSESKVIELSEIEDEVAVPISTMPDRLLNTLNGDEIRDLIAYLVSSGDVSHPAFK